MFDHFHFDTMTLFRIISEVKCPNNMEFKSCSDPCQPTCQEKNPPECKDGAVKAQCVEGCFCTGVLIRDGDRCVEDTNCGCYKNKETRNEIYYPVSKVTLCTCQSIGGKNASQIAITWHKTCQQCFSGVFLKIWRNWELKKDVTCLRRYEPGQKAYRELRLVLSSPSEYFILTVKKGEVKQIPVLKSLRANNLSKIE